MTDPLVEAVADILEQSLRDIRSSIEGLSSDLLNRRPAGPDTNPIGVLAVHALSSTRWWFSVATDAPPRERDRPAEFLTMVDDTEAFLGVVDGLSADCRAILDGAAPIELGAMRTSAPSYGPPETVTAAWALVHAIEHLREHVAHLQLTRQLLEEGSSG